MTHHVSYPWSNGNGVLAVIQGAEKYLEEMGLDYVQPVQPQHQHPELFVTVLRVPTQQQVKNFKAQNENWKRDYAVYSGFCKGVRENMMKALDARYYEQLSHQRYKYRDVLPQDFIEHLETKWVFLDKIHVQQLKDEYYKKWSADEHISAFARRLNEDQEKLASDGVTISNVDKNQHYMMQIWKSEMFNV